MLVSTFFYKTTSILGVKFRKRRPLFFFPKFPCKPLEMKSVCSILLSFQAVIASAQSEFLLGDIVCFLSLWKYCLSRILLLASKKFSKESFTGSGSTFVFLENRICVTGRPWFFKWVFCLYISILVLSAFSPALKHTYLSRYITLL